MRALILGGSGQLGRALERACPAGATSLAPTRSKLSIHDVPALRQAMTAFRPDVVFNAAAYTAVDAAETDEKRARQVNDEAVGNLAEVTAEAGARLVHVSTDFVFDGASGTPYVTSAPTNPLNVYGLTKRDGERKALSVAQARPLVVRTAWVYGATGSNFVKTMLALMASKPLLSVVDDQIGSPTLVGDLAVALWTLAAEDVGGVLHYTNSGVASWYDFAMAIQEEALALDLLMDRIPVHPVSSVAFPRPARRPSYSVLDKSETTAALGAAPAHWRVRLRAMLKEI